MFSPIPDILADLSAGKMVILTDDEARENEGDIIFAAWFTYNTDHTPLWLVATMPLDATGSFTGTLYRLSGPPYSAMPWDPANVKVTAVGDARLTFASGTQALFAYTVDGVSQGKTITREFLRSPGTYCQ